MEGLEIKEISVYDDQRGWLAEIFRSDESALKPLMCYVSMTEAGVVRGPHEHREQTDYFCFLGKFRLYFWDNRKSSSSYQKKEIIDISKVPSIAIVPPGIVHAYKNIGAEDAAVLNLPDRLYKGWGKTDSVDEIRYEDNPLSPYRIEE